MGDVRVTEITREDTDIKEFSSLTQKDLYRCSGQGQETRRSSFIVITV